MSAVDEINYDTLLTLARLAESTGGEDDMRFVSNLYIVDETDRVYYLIRQLGSGGFGAVFSAVANDAYRTNPAPPANQIGFTLRQFREPTHTLKMISGNSRYRDATVVFSSIDPLSPETPLDDRAALRSDPLRQPNLAALRQLGFAPADSSEQSDRTASSPTDSTQRSVRREAVMGMVVNERLGEPFCSNQAVCATDYFFVGIVGVIVFPFVRATSLFNYLNDTVNPEVGNIERAIKEIRYKSIIGGRTKKFETMRELLDFYYNEEDQLALHRPADLVSDEQEERFFDLQDAIADLVQRDSHVKRIVYELSLQVARIVAMLHGARIYHGDIKPDNFLVYSLPESENRGVSPKWVLDGDDPQIFRLRIIDFGLSCALALEGESADTVFSTNMQWALCEGRYTGTRIYVDPMARLVNAHRLEFAKNNIQPADEVARLKTDEAMEALEMYSVGKTVMALGDPLHIRNGNIETFPVVRKTKVIDDSLAALLASITGEFEYDEDNMQTWSRQDLLRNTVVARMRGSFAGFTFTALSNAYQREAKKAFRMKDYDYKLDPRYTRLLSRRDASSFYGQLVAQRNVMGIYFEDLLHSFGFDTESEPV